MNAHYLVPGRGWWDGDFFLFAQRHTAIPRTTAWKVESGGGEALSEVV